MRATGRPRPSGHLLRDARAPAPASRRPASQPAPAGPHRHFGRRSWLRGSRGFRRRSSGGRAPGIVRRSSGRGQWDPCPGRKSGRTRPGPRRIGTANRASCGIPRSEHRAGSPWRIGPWDPGRGWPTSPSSEFPAAWRRPRASRFARCGSCRRVPRPKPAETASGCSSARSGFGPPKNRSRCCPVCVARNSRRSAAERPPPPPPPSNAGSRPLGSTQPSDDPFHGPRRPPRRSSQNPRRSPPPRHSARGAGERDGRPPPPEKASGSGALGAEPGELGNEQGIRVTKSNSYVWETALRLVLQCTFPLRAGTLDVRAHESLPCLRQDFLEWDAPHRDRSLPAPVVLSEGEGR